MEDEKQHDGTEPDQEPKDTQREDPLAFEIDILDAVLHKEKDKVNEASTDKDVKSLKQETSPKQNTKGKIEKNGKKMFSLFAVLKKQAKLRRLLRPQEKQEVSDYYLKQSKRFKFLKLSFVTLLICFVVCMIVFFRDSITAENLQYFLRYIDTRQADTNESSVIKYDATSLTDETVYKGGLVVVDSDKVELYDMSGDNILSASQRNTQPSCIASDSYILVYNIGSTGFQIYNSLSCLYSENYDNPISCAAINDNGMFLIGTKALEYRSVVNVYDKNFKQIYSWSSPDKYLMSADLDTAGKQIVLSSLGSNPDGTCYTTLSIYSLDSEKAKTEITIQDNVPLRVKFNRQGGVVLVCDKGIYFYDADLKEIQNTSFESYVPIKAETNGEYTYYVLNKNVVGSTYQVIILDRNGKILYSGDVEGEITDETSVGGLFYFLLERKIICIDPKASATTSMDVDFGGIALDSTEDNLLLCMQGKTQIISLTDFHKNAK